MVGRFDKLNFCLERRLVLNNFCLDDAVIVLTGGSGFLGQNFAEAILKAGGSVVVLDVANKDVNFSDQIIAEKKDNRFLSLECDITNEPSIQDALEKTIYKFGRVDGLINAASNNPAVSSTGLKSQGRLEDFELSQWNSDIAVGLTGAFLCSKVFGHYMANGDGGVILNIASDLGLIAPDQRLYRKKSETFQTQSFKPVTYSVVKSGLIGLTKYLATYWPEGKVRSNALAPGGVYNGQDEEFLEKVHSLIPLGRMARRDEYSAAVVFLLSKASSYMNGTVLTLDGGRTVW